MAKKTTRSYQYRPGSLCTPPVGFSTAIDLAAGMLVDPACGMNPSNREYHAQAIIENFAKPYTKDDTWRVTHITPGALRAIVAWDLDRKGKKPTLNCCHGIIGRLDRSARFKAMMEMYAAGASIEELWLFYIEHDASVLALGSEHKKGWNPGAESLVEVPSPTAAGRLFPPRGFGVRLAAPDIEWVREALAGLQQ